MKEELRFASTEQQQQKPLRIVGRLGLSTAFGEFAPAIGNKNQR